MSANGYVHGFGTGEGGRLRDQARALENLLHAGTRYPAGSTVLEAGCGVGAQTAILARNSPGAVITAVDSAAETVAAARRATAALPDVSVLQADILDLPFAPESFDNVFVCFVLEHLREPVTALAALRRVLKPGGTLTVVEGDHGTACFHPDDADARTAIACQVALQRMAGGDALVGRRLHPLVREAGFEAVRVSPRLVYVDASRPDLAECFVRRTFAAMVAGVAERAVRAGLTDAARFAAGLEALGRTAGPGGTFCYTFFKAWARAPGDEAGA